MIAATTSGLVAGGVVLVAAIGLAAIQARRRTLTRGRDRAQRERRPDDS